MHASPQHRINTLTRIWKPAVLPASLTAKQSSATRASSRDRARTAQREERAGRGSGQDAIAIATDPLPPLKSDLSPRLPAPISILTSYDVQDPSSVAVEPANPEAGTATTEGGHDATPALQSQPQDVQTGPSLQKIASSGLPDTARAARVASAASAASDEEGDEKESDEEGSGATTRQVQRFEARLQRQGMVLLEQTFLALDARLRERTAAMRARSREAWHVAMREGVGEQRRRALVVQHGVLWQAVHDGVGRAVEDTGMPSRYVVL